MKKTWITVLAMGMVFAFAGISLAAEEGAKELKGDAGCSMCAFKAGGGCAAAVKIGDTVYTLKPSDAASADTKKLIASFSGAAKTTAVAIQGVIQDKAILADSVVKVEVKKEG